MTSINANGATASVYLRSVGGTSEFSTDNLSWNSISWPATITNTNPSASSILKVLFLTDLTFSISDNAQFICNSSHIQFGSTSLNANGTVPTITVDGVANFPGLVQNGTNSDNGFNSIFIYNLAVIATSGATLATNSGWFGQDKFAKGAINNYIINCSSSGPISTQSGGIVGVGAASNSGNLTIIGCSSTGEVAQFGGGIVGANAADISGTVTVQQCFTSGDIQTSAGGIVGRFVGSNGGSVSVTDCYSTGLIGTSAGGICGSDAGIGGSIIVTNCYSTGAISSSGGGIFGSEASTNGGSAIAQNCYSTGAISSGAGGIFGDNYTTIPPAVVLAQNCYTSGAGSGGGIYAGSNIDGPNNKSEANPPSSSSGWSTTNATAVLTGFPTTTAVGTTWTSLGINTPYELTNMGYSPYTTTNISAGPALVRSISRTVTAGTTTPAALITTDHTFSLLRINNDTPSTYPTLTISSTGAITAGSTTPAATYTLYVRDSVNPYSITTYLLTITAAPPALEGTTTANCCAPVTRSSDYSFGWMYNVQEGNTSITEQAKTQAIRFTSYDAYMRYVMSLGTRR